MAAADTTVENARGPDVLQRACSRQCGQAAPVPAIIRTCAWTRWRSPPARSALASANVRPSAETTEPALSSLRVATSWVVDGAIALVNSITNRHLIALFPGRRHRGKVINPRFWTVSRRPGQVEGIAPRPYGNLAVPWSWSW